MKSRMLILSSALMFAVSMSMFGWAISNQCLTWGILSGIYVVASSVLFVGGIIKEIHHPNKHNKR